MRGKRLGYVRGEHGNVGDTLQERAAFLLFREAGLNVRWVGPVVSGREPWDWQKSDGLWNGRLPFEVDELLLFGGGNMGLKGGSYAIRRKAAVHGLPMTILPNSWRAPEMLAGRVRYCAREAESARLYCPAAELNPDMALSYDFPDALRRTKPRERLGVFLRDDREALFAGQHVPGDRGPAFKLVGKRNVAQYLRLAAEHETIVTDTLHFAIAGLAAGRRVYLLPGGYHKNRSMYETWLAALGCQWAETPAAVEELRP
jgi:exopolysaccharide biosynthesis predicted pyruvyltransferase EpsI